MKNIIIKLLTQSLSTTFLEVLDISASHADHNPAARAGGTHFEMIIVSPKFVGKSRVQRHRMIYKMLAAPLKTQIHALTITALTPQEHQKSN